jgi:hypothetical protein
MAANNSSAVILNSNNSSNVEWADIPNSSPSAAILSSKSSRRN